MEGRVSADIGDDAHGVGTADFIEQVNGLRTILNNAGDAAHDAMAAGQWDGNVEHDNLPAVAAASASPGQDGGEEAADEYDVVVPAVEAQPRGSASLEEDENGCQPVPPALMFLDIVRPGTVICNGSIEVPECVLFVRLDDCHLACGIIP